MLHTQHAWTNRALCWRGAALILACTSKKLEVLWLGSGSCLSLQVPFLLELCNVMRKHEKCLQESGFHCSSDMANDAWACHSLLMLLI